MRGQARILPIPLQSLLLESYQDRHRVECGRNSLNKNSPMTTILPHYEMSSSWVQRVTTNYSISGWFAALTEVKYLVKCCKCNKDIARTSPIWT